MLIFQFELVISEEGEESFGYKIRASYVSLIVSGFSLIMTMQFFTLLGPAGSFNCPEGGGDRQHRGRCSSRMKTHPHVLIHSRWSKYVTSALSSSSPL